MTFISPNSLYYVFSKVQFRLKEGTVRVISSVVLYQDNISWVLGLIVILYLFGEYILKLVVNFENVSSSPSWKFCLNAPTV